MARAASSPSLNPELLPGDPETARWLAQVTLRLRRELTWLRRHREEGESAGSAQEALDLTRFHDEKLAFFAQDATARWLRERMAEASSKKPAANSAWRRAATALGLDDAAQFVLACALAARVDAAFGPVAGAANGEAGRGHASLALAQRLWDEPLAVLPCADSAHPLQRSGLIAAPAGRDAHDWSAPLWMPAAVAQVLLGGEGMALPAGLRALAPNKAQEPTTPLVHWLRATPIASMQVVPIVAPRGADLEAAVASVASASQRRVAAIGADLGPQHPGLPGLAAAAWLLDLALAAIPVRWFVPVADAAPHSAGIATLAPALTIAPLAMAERRRRFEALVLKKDAKTRAADAARRFRVEERAVARIETAMRASTTKPDVYELARVEAATHMAQLATPVSPRFTLDELVLPPRETRALDAIVTAMRTLGRVHEEWGTGRAWNEGGLAVMFCGPPGTGKTMAAEALSASLELPMYRVDLSQVVNKYIGETEKNLRRIFDAAESSDCLLFFDEADALFGKRTEVRDSHDRFANLEISYLLERMERFRGLAILATNRRKDLDTAFLRRLRYIVEFPVPGVAERARLWAQVFPAAVDTSGVDIDFLARRFEVAGGAIRSAAFNACLQAAARQRKPSVAMTDVVRAVKSELEKSGPEIADEQFGSYAHLLKEST
jgi:ATPase family associated with various cellular activities (AAA)